MRVRSGRVAVLAGAALLLLAALLPPLEPMAEELFSAHMVQHLLLGLVVPGMVVGATPVGRVDRWIPGPLRRAPLGAALLAAGGHVFVMVFWHVPAVYDGASRMDALHLLMHGSYVVSGLFLWWAAAGGGHPRSRGRGVVVLFLAGMPTGALGALLALAPEPLYDSHLSTATAWGLTPLEDQQLAGGIMWVPGGIVYLVAAFVLVVRWLAEEEARLRAAAAIALVVASSGLLGCGGERLSRPPEFRGGDPENGHELIQAYGCGSCHDIPGVKGANGTVGPPLTKFGRRSYIAGSLVNNEDNLIRWIMNPQAVEPGTAMPDLDVSRDEAHDIAAYLHTLD